jgi:organic radical activating enzyme
MNQKQFKDLTPPEMEIDSTATEVTPRLLEVYFTNLCNLACLYCGPHFSTVWANEYRKHGIIDREGFRLEDKNTWHENYEEMKAELWKWMEKNSRHLRKFHILGGEPFFQPEFIECLDHFERFPNRNLEFVIITNLMVDDKRMDYYLDRFRQLIKTRSIKLLQVSASLDCWGPQQEYVRSGLDLAQWQRNFEKLLAQKWIRLQINQAISALTIHTMPALYDKINEWNRTHKVFPQFMTVTDPKYMRPDIFEPDVFREPMQKVLDRMRLEHHYDSGIRSYMEGIAKQISASGADIEKLRHLKIYLEEIDKRRNTDYTVLFPWLPIQFERHGL